MATKEMSVDIFAGDLRVEKGLLSLKRDIESSDIKHDISDWYASEWSVSYYEKDEVDRLWEMAKDCLSHAYKQVSYIDTKQPDERPNFTEEIQALKEDYKNLLEIVDELQKLYGNADLNEKSFNRVGDILDLFASVSEALASLENDEVDELIFTISSELMAKIPVGPGLQDWSDIIPVKLCEIGDYYLFDKGRVHKAEKFYETAMKDWDKRIIDEEENLFDVDFLSVIGSYNVCAAFKLALRKGMPKIEVPLVGAESLDEESLALANSFLEVCEEHGRKGVWDEELSHETWQRANNFFSHVLYKIRSLDNLDKLEMYRSIILIAYATVEFVIGYGLYCLAHSSRSEDEEAKRAIMPDEKYYELVQKYSDFEIFSFPVKEMDSFVNSHNQGDRAYARLRELLFIIGNVEMIKRILLVRKAPKDMAYYTTFNTLGYLLPKSADLLAEENKNAGKFSVMNIGHMNDPNEGKIFEKVLFGNDSYKTGTSDDREELSVPYVFLKSFTTRIDDLSMWETYGESAKGVCVVLDSNIINRIGDYGLYNICYLKKAKSSKSRLGYEVCTGSDIGIDKKGANVVASILGWLKDEVENRDLELGKKDVCKAYPKAMEYLHYRAAFVKYLFKDADYIHEDEKRIIYMIDSYKDKRIHNTGGDIAKLFVYSQQDAIIKEVILGPKFTKAEDKLPYLQYRCQALAEKLKLDEIKITKSHIAYI